MTFERALELILGNLGTLVLLLFILIGGFRGWWVYGRFYDDQTKRIERLEQRVDRTLGAGERIAGTADRATRLAEGARTEGSRD